MKYIWMAAVLVWAGAAFASGDRFEGKFYSDGTFSAYNPDGSIAYTVPTRVERNYVRAQDRKSGTVEVTKTIVPTGQVYAYVGPWRKLDQKLATYGFTMDGKKVLGSGVCINRSLCYDASAYAEGLTGFEAVRHGIEKVTIYSDNRFAVDGTGTDENGKLIYSYRESFHR